jgi:hypothetical protein
MSIRNIVPEWSLGAMLRQTILLVVRFALGGAMLLMAGCEDTQKPTLCVFTSNDFTGANTNKDPESFPCRTPMDVVRWDKEPVQCDTVITSGGVIYIRHTLPDDVNPSGPLALRMETPCGTKAYDVPYVDGIALWSGETPIGAACSMVITAVLENSELRCSLNAPDATTCTDICPKEVTP